MCSGHTGRSNKFDLRPSLSMNVNGGFDIVRKKWWLRHGYHTVEVQWRRLKIRATSLLSNHLVEGIPTTIVTLKHAYYRTQVKEHITSDREMNNFLEIKKKLFLMKLKTNSTRLQTSNSVQDY